MRTNPKLLKPIAERMIQVYYTLYSQRMVKTKAEFCRKVNIHPCYFNQIESGIHYPTLSNICTLMAAYNINATWLFNGKGNMFN